MLAKDPGRLMSLEAPSWTQDVAGKWANKDVEGFAGWLTDQPAEVVNTNAPMVVNQLNRQKRFDEAIGWAMAMDSNRQSYVSSTLYGWTKSNPLSMSY